MSTSTPWKHAIIGGAAIVAGIVLLSVDWTIATLAAFAGFALLARGTLHAVASTAFVGFAGAFAVLAIAGDVGVGITALAWPNSTVTTLSVLVGSWAVVRSFAGATIGVTTRAEHTWWLLFVALAAVGGILGIMLVARAGGASAHDAAVLIGLLALVDGAREVAEAGSRHRRERRLTHGARAHVPAPER